MTASVQPQAAVDFTEIRNIIAALPAMAPVALPSTRFQRVPGQRTQTEEFDKVKITEDIRGLMHGFKDLTMNDIAYRLKIADKPWAGRVIREILTNLEQEGFLFKEGEKRGMRYILNETKTAESEVTNGSN